MGQAPSLPGRGSAWPETGNEGIVTVVLPGVICTYEDRVIGCSYNLLWVLVGRAGGGGGTDLGGPGSWTPGLRAPASEFFRRWWGGQEVKLPPRGLLLPAQEMGVKCPWSSGRAPGPTEGRRAPSLERGAPSTKRADGLRSPCFLPVTVLALRRFLSVMNGSWDGTGPRRPRPPGTGPAANRVGFVPTARVVRRGAELCAGLRLVRAACARSFRVAACAPSFRVAARVVIFLWPHSSPSGGLVPTPSRDAQP